MKILITLSLLFSQASIAQEFKEKAPLVTQALKKNLMGSLAKKISQEGATAAVDFCHLNVKPLGQKTSQEFNGKYDFGRVSHKIRNPKNAPQDWMKPYLEKFKDKKQSSPDSSAFFHTQKDGTLVYLEPLWVAPMCLQCHGENVALSVSSEIKKRYPKDEARGFKVGDFRGFIWVKEK